MEVEWLTIPASKFLGNRFAGRGCLFFWPPIFFTECRRRYISCVLSSTSDGLFPKNQPPTSQPLQTDCHANRYRKSQDPHRVLAVYQEILRQNRGHQIRRPCHGGRGAEKELRPGHHPDEIRR